MRPALLVSMIVVAVLTAWPARAQDEPTNAVGLSVSYVTPKDLEQGVGMGFSYTHVMAMLLSFEFGIEHYTFDHRDTALGTTKGTVSETPLLITAQIRPQFDWNPYLGFGVGYYLMSYDQTNQGATLCGCEFTVDNAVVVHVAAGFDVPVNDRLTLTIDVRSTSGDADATKRDLVLGASVNEQLKLDYLKVGVGLKYWF